MSRQQVRTSDHGTAHGSAAAAYAHENMPPFYALTYIIRKERL